MADVKSPSQEEDKAIQSINFKMKDRGTQTNVIQDERKNVIISDFVPTNGDDTLPIHTAVFKLEEQQDVIETDDQEDYVLDYECSEYISSDMYVIGDTGSMAEGSEYPTIEKIVYKEEADEEMETAQLEILELTELNDVVKSRQQSSLKRSKKTTTCNICKIDIKTGIIKTHRSLHQQTLPMILDSIPYFRCGRCKTVFSEINHMKSHFINGSCCSYNDERSCTDYQYLEEFPECDTEEEGPFSGCRTLRLCSIDRKFVIFILIRFEEISVSYCVY